jgi:Arf-GAP/GTPase/ANK repeat/PH domain-containing protein 1/3
MGKFIVPSEKNFVSQHLHHQHPSGTENKENQQKAADLHQTPSSTPTSARKNRRRSNLFTPSKKSSDDKSGGGSGGGGAASAASSHGVPNQPQMGSGRCIPMRQGYLYKKSNKSFSKDWKKKYVTLSDDFKMTYHPSMHDYMENVHGKEISLQYVTVKVPGQKPRGSRTVPNSSSTTNTSSSAAAAAAAAAATGIVGAADSSMTSNFNGKTTGANGEKVLLTGYELIKEPSGGEDNNETVNGTVAAADKSMAETPNVKKRHRRMKSNGVKSSSGNGDIDDSDMFEFNIVSLDNKQWFFEASSAEERDEWVGAIEQQILNSLQVTIST